MFQLHCLRPVAILRPVDKMIHFFSIVADLYLFGFREFRHILYRELGKNIELEIVNAYIVSGLKKSDMDENFLDLLDILTQSACLSPNSISPNKRSYLKKVELYNIVVDVELLIGTDAPKDDGPFAVRSSQLGHQWLNSWWRQ